METNKIETALRARQLTKQKLYGVLATQSVAMPGIERQLSLPVNDNYNCRLNHPNLAWFSLQLQY